MENNFPLPSTLGSYLCKQQGRPELPALEEGGVGIKPNSGGQAGKVQGLRPAATWAYAVAPPSGPARALSLEPPCTCSS